MIGTGLGNLETATSKYRLNFADCCYQIYILFACLYANLSVVVHLCLFLPNNDVTAILMKGEAVTSLFQIHARREFTGVV